jgi:hypothetical protein
MFYVANIYISYAYDGVMLGVICVVVRFEHLKEYFFFCSRRMFQNERTKSKMKFSVSIFRLSALKIVMKL